MREPPLRSLAYSLLHRSDCCACLLESTGKGVMDLWMRLTRFRCASVRSRSRPR
jgi:hypothetical protein